MPQAHFAPVDIDERHLTHTKVTLRMFYCDKPPENTGTACVSRRFMACLNIWLRISLLGGRAKLIIQTN